MAPPIRRQIRPVRIVPQEEVEDQLWPVNLAIVILAGFVVGLILAISRFDDPRLFYNAYFQLLTVGLTLVVWFVGVRWVRGRLQQRIKIAALFSLLVHLWLLLSLGVGYYRLVVQPKPGLDKVEEIAELTVPEYAESVMEDSEAPSEYHRPVDTPLPQAQVPQSPKEPEQHRVPGLEKPSEAIPQRSQPDPLPPLPLQRREVAQPHRGELSGEQIRRQVSEPRQEPVRPVPLPEIRPASPPRGPSAKMELPDRRASELPRMESPKSSPPSVEQPTPKAELGAPRQRQAVAPELSPAVQSTPKREVRSAPEPSVQADAPPPQAPAPTVRPSPYQPRPLALERFRSAPVESKPSAKVEAPTPQPPPQSSIVQRTLDPSPQIAQTPDRLPSRQSDHEIKASVSEEPLPEVAVAPQVQTPLAPSALATIARQNPAVGHLAQRPSPPQALALQQRPTTFVAVQSPRHPDSSAIAGLQLQAGPTDRTAPRSPQWPRLDGTTAEQPTPTSSPPVAALGSGQGDSVARQQEYHSAGLPRHQQSQALAGSLHPVTGAGTPLPAAAARRAQASQEGVEGIVAPTQPVAMLPRTQPGTPIPSSTAPHEEASLAGAVGSAHSSGGELLTRWEAGSNTAVARQTPGAPVGQGGRSVSSPHSPAPSGPGGVVTGTPRPSGVPGPSLSFGDRPELGRSSTGADRLAGLEGTGPLTVPGPASTGAAGSASSGSGSTQEASAVQPGTISVGRTAQGGGLPGTRTRGETSWQIPAGGGAVALAQLHRSGGGGERSPGVLQEGGMPGPSRTPGRLPTADLAGQVPEPTPSSGPGGGPRGSTETPGSEGTNLEPGLAGGDRSASTLPDRLASGGIGGAGKTPSGSLPSSSGEIAGGPAIGSRVGTGQSKERTEPGFGDALAGTGIPRSARGDLPSTEAEMIPGPAGSGAQAGTPQGDSLSAGVEGVEVGRQGTGLPVHIAARPGAGGLNELPSPSIGLPSRRATSQSEDIHLASGRFLLQRSASPLSIDSRAAPAQAFRQRHPTRRGQEAHKYGGSEESEQAVERGLEFLAKLQWPDGRWRFHLAPDSLETWPGEDQARQQPDRLLSMTKTVLQDNLGTPQLQTEIKRLLSQHASGGLGAEALNHLAQLVRQAVFVPGRQESDSAATGLALLAFLGAGYTHQEGKYRTQVQRGLEWLLANQKPDGDLWGYTQGSKDTWLYSHGIAAIALCEAYGMTKDPGLRRPAEQAIGFIVAAQHPTRGGWRYQPRESSDTSVSGWQLMALKSAQMAGLQVPQTTLDLVSHWLDLAQAPGGDGSRYVYNPLDDPNPLWREPTLAMTAEALLMRMYLGWNRDHALLQRGAEVLQANLPEVGTLDQPSRDAYYWYYATQVMFQMAGSSWESWNNRLRPYLESSQVKEGPLAGSWHPDRPVPDRFAADGGRLYVTTLHLLMLEVYYRHLPLFKTLRDDEPESPQTGSSNP